MEYFLEVKSKGSPEVSQKPVFGDPEVIIVPAIWGVGGSAARGSQTPDLPLRHGRTAQCAGRRGNTRHSKLPSRQAPVCGVQCGPGCRCSFPVGAGEEVGRRWRPEKWGGEEAAKEGRRTQR